MQETARGLRQRTYWAASPVRPCRLRRRARKGGADAHGGRIVVTSTGSSTGGMTWISHDHRNSPTSSGSYRSKPRRSRMRSPTWREKPMPQRDARVEADWRAMQDNIDKEVKEMQA